MNKYTLPSQKELLNTFQYNHITGELTWKTSPVSNIKIGDIAGCKFKNGYIYVGISGKQYRAHRIIWKIIYGYDPGEIDHKNHNKSDNSLKNLREVTHIENMRNQKTFSNNTSKTTGVYWHKRKELWQASIGVKGKLKHLGYFNCINAAISARKKAEETHGFHKNHGT